MNAGTCATLYNGLSAGTKALAFSGAATAAVAGKITSLFAWLNTIPVYGWIVFGVVAAIASFMAVNAVIAATKGTGFYVGVNVNFFGKTKWEYSFR